jgi:hypothetical protein
VSYATSHGTAGSSDYTAASGTLTFNQGVFSQTFSVSTTNDAVREGDETVNLALSGPTGGATLGTPASAVLTITDNDPAPVVQFSSATYSNSEGSSPATITITRTNDATTPVVVTYATSDGTAAAGSDYTAASGSLTFNQGVFSQTFNVPITNDMIFEGDETVNLALSVTSGGSPGTPASAVLTIVDNDPAPAIQFFSPTYLVGEGGTATITVTRINDAVAPVTVSYATSHGTAGAGDYTAASGTLTFNQGVFSQTFSVSTIDDAVQEGDETVNLALSSPSGSATLGAQSSAVLTIADNDLAPVVEFSAATYSVGEGGSARSRSTASTTH